MKTENEEIYDSVSATKKKRRGEEKKITMQKTKRL